MSPGDVSQIPAAPKRQRALRVRQPLPEDSAWNAAEVAHFLGVCESTVRNFERDGQLPALPRSCARLTFDPKVVRAFRDGWRPPPGWRPPVPAPQVVPIDIARTGKR